MRLPWISALPNISWKAAEKDKVNEGLQQVLADGTFDKLAEKYGIADMVCLEKKGE